MLFNSFEFLVFLIIVFSAYWLARQKVWLQNLIILVSSYVFYGWWNWRFMFLIAGCSCVNYLGALVIENSTGKLARRLTVAFCCLVSLGTLGVYKYFNFFVENLTVLMNAIGLNPDFVTLKLVLPVGISFFIFQALSYTIDVALGRMRATRNIIDFFAYISFFPQLVAGPIERATNLLPQFARQRTFNCATAMDGLCLIAYGLAKKMVVADTLAMYVDNAYLRPGFYSSVTCVIAAVFFAMQIYCDFSGYSDAARGFAKLFGFELMVNFNRPYMASSFADFWRRWHISLSSWFKDYVYIPLGGNRVSLAKLIRNLWIVFLLSGLWHGASWTFIGWGGVHAAFLTAGCMWRKLGLSIWKNRFTHLVSIAVVDFGVTIAWVLFRAGTVECAKNFLGVLFAFKSKTTLMALCAGIGPMSFLFCIIAALLLVGSHFVPDDCKFRSEWSKITFAIACITSIVFFGMPAGGEFIYFRF